MATTGTMNGTLLGVYIGSDKFGHTRSSSISFTQNTDDATSADSNGWEEHILTSRNVTINFEGLFTFDDTLNPVGLVDEIIARTQIAWQFSTQVSGDVEYTGTGTLTNVTIDSPAEAIVTYSGTILVDGAPTKATVGS